MIGAALIALVTHIQVLPLIDVKTLELQPGAVIYAEPSPDTRLTLSFTHTSTSTGVKFGTRFQF